jgi:hypothetical protein
MWIGITAVFQVILKAGVQLEICLSLRPQCNINISQRNKKIDISMWLQ